MGYRRDEDAIDYYKSSIYEDKLMDSIEDTEGYDCFKKEKMEHAYGLRKNGLCGMYGRFEKSILQMYAYSFQDLQSISETSRKWVLDVPAKKP